MEMPATTVSRAMPGAVCLLVAICLLLPVVGAARNLLNQPESVVYDAPNKRYLVSNWGSGHLVQIDSTGAQSYFSQYQQCYAGLHIIDDTVYVACRQYGVKGFDLTTGQNVLDVSIPEAGNINDITADDAGNLYVSWPTGDTIFKVSIAGQVATPFVESGLDTPNGLYFDQPNSRLLLVSYRPNSPIQAVDLEDSTLSTVVPTNLHNLDGLTQDNEGRFYVSSWYSNACFRFDAAFTEPPELFSSHPDDPADIYFNRYEDVLAVPLFFTHAVEFVTVTTAVADERGSRAPGGLALLTNYPNPFRPRTTIEYDLPRAAGIRLDIYSAQGRWIRTLISEHQPAGRRSVVWDGTDDSGRRVGAGVYWSVVHTDDAEMPAQSRKMLVLD